MPGRSPSEAVDAFLDPLRAAVACVGGASFTLTQGARGNPGQTYGWTLNGDDPIRLGNGRLFRAAMQFETLDRGQSQGAHRYKVSTRGYMYSVLSGDGKELLAAHWHPNGSSSYHQPHWHVGSAALAEDGVFLERAHIPSHRVSLEEMIRMLIDQLDVTPSCDDWSERLATSETTFREHSSWGPREPAPPNG